MGLALFDSNIVMDALNGYTQAVAEISYFSDIAISAVVWVEVMAKPLAANACDSTGQATVQMALDFLSSFTIIMSYKTAKSLTWRRRRTHDNQLTILFIV